MLDESDWTRRPPSKRGQMAHAALDVEGRAVGPAADPGSAFECCLDGCTAVIREASRSRAKRRRRDVAFDMELPIILSALLTTLTSNPDLCASVYVDADGTPYTDANGLTWSRFCAWTGPDAAVLDADVCCTLAGDTAACTLPNRKGRCSSGSMLYYCEYGEVTSTGGVICQRPYPSICDFGFCGDVLPPGSGPLENSICCWGDSCFELETVEDILNCDDIGGYGGYCKNGAQSVDGTVECFD